MHTYVDGLKDTEEILETEKELKNRARALKAWETRKKNKEAKEKKESYDRPKKNEVRDKVVSYILNHEVKSVLTLETHEFLFAKELPELKIIVAEQNKKEYGLMQETKPENVFLYYGNIEDYGAFNLAVDVVYLDFCCTITKAEESIRVLSKSIESASMLVFTFCLRKNSTKNIDDYKFDLVSRLQESFRDSCHLYLKDAISYRDSTAPPMITLIFDVGWYGKTRRKIHYVNKKNCCLCTLEPLSWTTNLKLVTCGTCLKNIFECINTEKLHQGSSWTKMVDGGKRIY